ncbi:hypothetical protein FI667_g6271, partial [Globisporangium splendens]
MCADAMQEQNAPTLSAKRFLWWNRTYGPKYQIASPSSVSSPAHERHNNASGAEPSARRVRKGEARTDQFKSSLGAVLISELIWLLAHSQNTRILSNLRCEGFRPLSVAGYGRDDIVDRMKVKFLLGEEACPHVIICTADDASISSSSATLPAPAHSDKCLIRLHIHFSEPVEDFIADDIAISNPSCCHITSFSMLRSDFYRVDLAVTSDFRRSASSDGNFSGNHNESSSLVAPSLYVEVPEGVARRLHTAQVFNSRSNRFVLLFPTAPNSIAVEH